MIRFIPTVARIFLIVIVGGVSVTSVRLKGDTVFVTGAAGFVGNNLIRSLAREKRIAIGLVRDEFQRSSVRDSGGAPVLGSLDSPEMEQWFKLGEVDVVVHAAAKMELNPRRSSDLWNVNVEGTRKVLSAAQNAGVRTFIFLSSSTVYSGEPGSGPYREGQLNRSPIGEYAQSKLEAERLVRRANSSYFRTIILRPALVWGKGDKSLRTAIKEKVQSGDFAWIDGGEYEYATCHVDNLVDSITRAIRFGAGGEIYNVADKRHITFRNFLTQYLPDVRFPHRSYRRDKIGFGRLAETCLSSLLLLHKVNLGVPTRTETAYFLKPNSLNIRKAQTELGYGGQLNPF